MEWFWGKGLIVELAGDGIKTRELSLDRRIYMLLNGGRGLAGYVWSLLVEETPPEPLSPENPLVVAPGGLVGSGLSTASKTTFVARSPQTGLLGRSVTGGRVGWEIRRAGYDFLAITGELDEPSILIVDKDGVRIENAEGLWGSTISKARRKLALKFKSYSDIIIGPAGENRSAIASIDTNGRQAGRTGLGAVMGSKKLKAILVKGWMDPVVNDRGEVLRLIRELNKATHTTRASKNLVEYGTLLMLEYTNKVYGIIPSLNWKKSTLSWCENHEQRHEELTRFAPKYRIGKNPCIYCGRPCSQVIRINGVEVDGPEYETVFGLGTSIGVCSIRDVALLNKLADDYGFDTISLGATIAWAIHAGEEGLLDVDISWGDTQRIAKLVEDMAHRRGIGDILADGALEASKKLGKGGELVIHVKGLEPPAYDARGLKGMALGYAVSSRGADHLTSGAYAFEIYGKLWRYEGVDRLTYEGKGLLVRDGEDLMAFYDNTGICKFSRGTLYPENIAPLWNAVTGFNSTPGDLLQAGERAVNIERLINLYLGLNPQVDDTLPKRLFTEPIDDGPSRGEVIILEEFTKSLIEYYTARGWTRNGIPLQTTLVRLGLADILPSFLLDYSTKSISS